MAAPSLPPFTVVGLLDNAQALTNCVYVHPSDLKSIADFAGLQYEAVKSKGVPCAVGEGIFFVR